LAVSQPDLSMAPGNDGGVRIDHDFALRVASQPGNFLCESDLPRLPGARSAVR
jgi:hypothetical protein